MSVLGYLFGSSSQDPNSGPRDTLGEDISYWYDRLFNSDDSFIDKAIEDVTSGDLIGMSHGVLDDLREVTGDGNTAQSGGSLDKISTDVSEVLGQLGSQISTTTDNLNQLAIQNTNAAMAYNAEQAALNREWQERMSNTAYQRARADLEAAGYNPILAQTQGAASAPSGTAASASAAETHQASSEVQKYQAIVAVVDSVMKGVNTAIKSFRLI